MCKKTSKRVGFIFIISILTLFASIFNVSASNGDVEVKVGNERMKFVEGYLVDITEEHYAYCTSIDMIKELKGYIALKKYYFGDLSEHYLPELGAYRIEADDKILMTDYYAPPYSPEDFYALQEDGTYVGTETGSKLRDANGEAFTADSINSAQDMGTNIASMFKKIYIFEIVGLIIVAAVLIFLGFMKRRRALYKSVIGKKSEVSMDELARVGKTTFDKAEKEINAMIRSGEIKGYIDTEKRVLILSSSPATVNNNSAQQSAKKIVEPQNCPSCGAPNSAEAVEKGKCEYCGAVLSKKSNR